MPEKEPKKETEEEEVACVCVYAFRLTQEK